MPGKRRGRRLTAILLPFSVVVLAFWVLGAPDLSLVPRVGDGAGRAFTLALDWVNGGTP